MRLPDFGISPFILNIFQISSLENAAKETQSVEKIDGLDAPLPCVQFEQLADLSFHSNDF